VSELGPPAAPFACAACGAESEAGLACPERGAGDLDHVLARRLDVTAVGFVDGDEDQPFVRFRRLLGSYHVARAGGLSDADFVAMVETLDAAVADVDGRGFHHTPFARSPSLTEAAGGPAWVKDETGQVAGSHKARHLFGIALHLAVHERIGRSLGVGPLAIASCGNAALAAGVVARAAGRKLRVFIPPDAGLGLVARLRKLGATIDVCHRQAGQPGDPTYRAFQAAVAAGALPFCCQGPDCGATIEGGQTLAWEMATALAKRGRALDRVFVQVGGGAFASALVRGLEEACALGWLPRMPRLHAVQTEGCAPLARAFERVQAHGGDMAWARAHKGEVMWPWEAEPYSLAHGILDDETYDWAVIVEGMLATGGSPVVVDEGTVRRAKALAGPRVSFTGAAGLAGLLALADRGELAEGEQHAVIFSGLAR
jgi:threonine dehydratase